MYKQVSQAKESIKTTLKSKVNKTVNERIKKENHFGDVE